MKSFPAAAGLASWNCFSTYPDIKFNIFISDSLHVEADGGYRVDRLAQLQLVQDGGLPRSVQTQHQDPHLLVPEHLGENLPHDESRDEGAGLVGRLVCCTIEN